MIRIPRNVFPFPGDAVNKIAIFGHDTPWSTDALRKQMNSIPAGACRTLAPTGRNVPDNPFWHSIHCQEGGVPPRLWKTTQNYIANPPAPATGRWREAHPQSAEADNAPRCTKVGP